MFSNGNRRFEQLFHHPYSSLKLTIPFMFKCKLSLDRIISLHLSKSFLSNASPKREAEIYQLIFRLPVLKFVEPMLGNSDDETLSLPRMTNNDQQSRTLEQLVTDNLLSLAHIYTLLAYTSRLGC